MIQNNFSSWNYNGDQNQKNDYTIRYVTRTGWTSKYTQNVDVKIWRERQLGRPTRKWDD